MAKLTFKQRTDVFNKELDAVLEKYDLVIITKMEFPQYNIVPDEVKLAVSVLNNHKVQLTSNVTEKPKK